MKVSVIGCGRWGTFLAWYLDRSGQEVTLYGRKGSRRMEGLLVTRTNGVTTLPESVELTQDLDRVLDCQVLVISVGSQSLRNLLQEIAGKGWGPGRKLVLCMKGLETGTGKRLSTIGKKNWGRAPGWQFGWGRATSRSLPQGFPTAWSLTATTRP